jgi:hypothetical protein
VRTYWTDAPVGQVVGPGLPARAAGGPVRGLHSRRPLKLLKVLPLAKGMFGPYREQLEAAGRADLLNA